MGPAGAAHLAAALKVNQVGDLFLMSCNQFTLENVSQTLITLNLFACPISDAGAAHLAVALKVNQVKKMYFALYNYLAMAITSGTHSVECTEHQDR